MAEQPRHSLEQGGPQRKSTGSSRPHAQKPRVGAQGSSELSPVPVGGISDVYLVDLAKRITKGGPVILSPPMKCLPLQMLCTRSWMVS